MKRIASWLKQRLARPIEAAVIATDSIIFIDPGHGGADPGAVHPQGYPREVDITMPAAMHLANVLRNKGYDVMLTPAVNLRPGEVFRSYQRAGWANERATGKRDLFVSIHCNSCNRQAKGTEVWYFGQKMLAEDLSYAASLGLPRNRGGKYRDDLAVLTKTLMPAVLIELGFIDAEPEWIQDNWLQQIDACIPVIERWMLL
jgi:N-acetylmuramoyl-L-alanine amidase